MAQVHSEPKSRPLSDGDVRPSVSSWGVRRSRQKYAVANQSIMSERIRACEEHAKRLEVHTKNLEIRVMMLEKIYIFMDWEKVGKLVDHYSDLPMPSADSGPAVERPPGLPVNAVGQDGAVDTEVQSPTT